MENVDAGAAAGRPCRKITDYSSISALNTGRLFWIIS